MRTIAWSEPGGRAFTATGPAAASSRLLPAFFTNTTPLSESPESPRPNTES